MNRLLYFLAIISLFNTACSGVKSASTVKKTPQKEVVKDDGSSVVYNPETKQYEKESAQKAEQKTQATPAKDTLKAKEVIVKKETPKEVRKPVVLPSNLRESKKKSSYNVALVLPFNTGDPQNSSTNVSRNSIWAVHFYSGVKLALKRFEQQGVQINLSVIDSKNSENAMEELTRRPELLNADMIIGPYSSSQAKVLIDFVKERKTILVSPYTTSSNPTTANPNYIQANPSINRHFEVLSKHLADNFTADRVVFLTQNTESSKSRSKNYLSVYKSFLKPEDSLKVREIIMPDDFLLSSQFKLDSTVTNNVETAFVISSWDERYVKDVLRKIENDKKETTVYVYGMPQWQYMENLKSQLTNLNGRISSNALLNVGSSSVEAFRNDYFNAYSKMPDIESFKGYDISYYFINQLLNKGDFFQKDLTMPDKELITRFNIKPVMNDLQPGIVDYFENYGLQILQFKWSNFDVLD